MQITLSNVAVICPSDHAYVFKVDGLKHTLRCRYYKKSGVFKLNRDGELSDFAYIEFANMKNGAQFHIDLGEDVYNCSLKCSEEAEDLQLMVGGVDFTKLPLAVETVKLHRSPVINNFTGRVVSTEYALRVGDGYIRVLCQHDKKTTTTSLICGKRKEIKKGKKLLDREQYPISLVIPEFSVKLSLDLDAVGKEFHLFVNGRSVYALPYVYGKCSIVATLATIGDPLTLTLLLLLIDPNQDPEAQIILAANVYINGESIVVPNPWS